MAVFGDAGRGRRGAVLRAGGGPDGVRRQADGVPVRPMRDVARGSAEGTAHVHDHAVPSESRDHMPHRSKHARSAGLGHGPKEQTSLPRLVVKGRWVHYCLHRDQRAEPRPVDLLSLCRIGRDVVVQRFQAGRGRADLLCWRRGGGRRRGSGGAAFRPQPGRGSQEGPRPCRENRSGQRKKPEFCGGLRSGPGQPGRCATDTIERSGT
mmetsp:Transcript_18726/g.46812  ORF Transcript_18726/g.46812 Transcript_18726/m.46812 type:complete len:208 (+) Transcript_18726:483-1106(+)